MQNTFISPIGDRYKAPILSKLWSPESKIILMRTLWLDLATFQKELGITAITDEGIAEMKSEIDYYKDFNNIDYEKISEYEKRFKHDIIAHIRAFSDICPKAKSFIHLGATSNFINDNVDMIIIKKSIETVSSLLTKRTSYVLCEPICVHGKILSFVTCVTLVPITVFVIKLPF